MPALHVRNLDDAVIEGLKRRARRNNRSLEGELRQILERASLEDGDAEEGRTRTITIRTVSVPGGGTYGREEIYGEDER